MLQHFLLGLEKYPDRLLISDGTRGLPRTFTYRQTMERVLECGAALERAGVEPGDRVLLLIGNCAEWVFIDLACQLLEAIPAALAPTASLSHMRAFVELITPRLVITEEISKFAEQGRNRHVCCVRELLAQRLSLGAARLSEYRYDPTRVLYLASTSGTTGGYKACMIRYENALASCASFSELIPLSPDDKNVCFLPLAQTRVNDLYFFLYCGGTVHFANPSVDLLSELRRHAPTFLASPPLVFQTVKKVHQGAAGRVALTELLGGATKLFTGTTPVAPSLLEYYAAFGAPLYEVYGMTECCSMATLNCASAARLGSAGRAHPGIDVRIAADGEIVVRGASVFEGYWGDDAATETALIEGALHTGDLGEVDGDGYLQLRGRKKDTVCLSTGKKIFPRETELVLSRLSSVKRVAIVGNTLRRPVAFVVLRPDDPETRRSFLAALHEVNAAAPYEDRINAAFFASRDLSVEAGELTPTGKPVRVRIEANYRAQLEEIAERN